ncbi:MAG: hypothetical protein MUC49_22775 [Raineya sp.]|jgi:hypothetical protein|nr:hypothetical protein [Raineya sp.]
MYLSKLLYLHPSQNEEVEASELQLQVCNWFVEEFGLEFNFFDDTHFIQDIENMISRVSITSEGVDIDLITNKDLDFFALGIDVKNEGYQDFSQEIYENIEGYTLGEIIESIHETEPDTYAMSVRKIWLINASLNGAKVPNYTVVRLLQEELHSSNPTNKINAMYAMFVNPLYRRYLLPMIQHLVQNDTDREVQKHAQEVILQFTKEEISEILVLPAQKLKLLSPSSPYKLPPEILEIHTQDTIEKKEQIIMAQVVSYYQISEIQYKEIYKVENVQLIVKDINKSKQLYTFENLEPFMVIWDEKAQHYPKKMQMIIKYDKFIKI